MAEVAEFGAVIEDEATFEALPEPLRRQFSKGEDGKFHQRPPNPDDGAEALKEMLAKAKRRQESAEKQLARFKDVDPDKYAEALQRLEEIEQEKLRAEGKESELWERRRVSLEEAHAKALAEKSAQVEKLQAELHRVLIDDGAVSLAAAVPGFKGTEKAVEILKRIARDELRVVEGVVTPVDADGNPRIVAGRTMTAKEWSEQLPKEYGGILFEESAGGGAGSAGRNGQVAHGKGLKDMSMAEKIALAKSEGPAAFRERAASAYR